MTDVIKTNIYVELDCLLDTRLALLMTIDMYKAMAVIKQPYYNRERDAFENFDTEEFQHYYKNRKKPILKNAVKTPIVSIIKELIIAEMMTGGDTADVVVPKVIVNLYPYELQDIEVSVLLRVIAGCIKDICDIETINIPPEELGPSYFKNNIDSAFMYDPIEWLEIHCANKNFEKLTCPDTVLYGPKLLKHNDITIFDKEFLARSGHDIFSVVELEAGPFINLNFLPVNNFCLTHKLDLYEDG